MARGNHQADDNRAEREPERGQVGTDQEHVAPSPPRGQQPQRGDEHGQPERPVDGAEVLRVQAGYDRSQDEQAHQAQEDVGADEVAAVQQERQQEGHRQHQLSEALADGRRDGEEGKPLKEGKGVEQEQKPGHSDQAALDPLTVDCPPRRHPGEPDAKLYGS